MDVDHWTGLVWRGSLQSLGLILFLSFLYRGRVFEVFRSIGLLGLLLAVVFTGSTILFLISISFTLVANTLVIISAAPFFAAAFSLIFLKEAVARHTWIAIVTAFAGIALLTLDSEGQGTIIGDLAALAVAALMGAYFTIVRATREVDMIPAMAVSGAMVAVIAFPLAAFPAMSQDQILAAGAMGFLVAPISFALITIGPRYLPAPEVSLLLLIETVLGPLWVWLVINEEPGLMSLIGGAVVVTTLLAHSIYGLRRYRRRQVASEDQAS
ncbi:DMT family transporter [Pelagibius sp. Alg239-R121]|uniref:DMT family transporter n=1 Tax=Pelagibius sp. Alg239-R121 TaxID=2993448 RepID=UPI0024A727B2|nr:DMT family transporter [Pelagibius sp. Alg239-R121]